MSGTLSFFALSLVLCDLFHIAQEIQDGLFGRKHPKISKNADNGKKNTETDAENSIPMFNKVAFHYGLPFCWIEECCWNAYRKS